MENFGFEWFAYRLSIQGLTQNIEWEEHLCGSDMDAGWSITRAFDGGLPIAGGTKSTEAIPGKEKPDKDYWVLKLGTFMEINTNENNSKVAPVLEAEGYGYDYKKPSEDFKFISNDVTP